MKEVTIYTDGACSGNPGPGGWGAILVYKNKEKILSGGEAHTTNNRMELSGAIAALEALREPCRALLVTDSQYLANGIGKGWAAKWRANGWKKPDGKPAQNADLWSRLLELLEIHEARFEWVRGHAGHPENERCDALAVAESKKAAAV